MLGSTPVSKIQAAPGICSPPEPGAFGRRILALVDRLAAHSEPQAGLSCTYMTPAHRAVAADLRAWMQAAGLEADIDGVGNVVGRFAAADPAAKALIVGSHYDTVRNGGRYDGRLGILAGLVVAEHLARAGQRLPFHLDVVGFAEEEGVRFATPYLGSAAIAGRFDPAWLARTDEGGARLGDVLRETGCDPATIPALARRGDLLGYVELHIEQGPVLIDHNLPVGIVTAIAGAVRHLVTVTGEAGHAGTVPMALRRDAAAAAAEIVLFVERRASATDGLVGTVGRLSVPDAAMNVIPGRCDLSLDIRSAEDAVRAAALADVLAEIDRIATRRRVTVDIRELVRTPAVACAPRLQSALAGAIARAGLKPFHLVSGAGHDAVMFDRVCDLAMLFVRCGNSGISHSPLETVTADDVDVAARVLLDAVVMMAEDAKSAG